MTQDKADAYREAALTLDPTLQSQESVELKKPLFTIYNGAGECIARARSEFKAWQLAAIYLSGRASKEPE
jgi:hypothetical protein